MVSGTGYERRRELELSLEHDDLKQEQRRHISGQLRKLYKVLEEEDSTRGEDPLIDKWERELAEGKIPDLDEQLPVKG